MRDYPRLHLDTKQRYNVFMSVLHFSHSRVLNNEQHSLLPPINTVSWNLYNFDVNWCRGFYFPFSTRKQNYGEVILQILLCRTSDYKVTNIDKTTTMGLPSRKQ